MNLKIPKEPPFPDQDTLRTWENMRKEILHELQEGASADVSDDELDEFGTFAFELDHWRAWIKKRFAGGLVRPNDKPENSLN